MAGANTTPIFPATPKIGSTGITIANFAKGGTVAFGVTGISGVTFATVFTAGVYGSRIDQIKVRPLGLNTTSVLRLFINEGLGAVSPNVLMHETSLTSVGSAGATLTVTAQTVAGSSFTASGAHGLSIGQIVFFGATSTLTAVTQNTAYYVTSVPTTTTFTLSTMAGASVPVAGAISGAGASLFPYTLLETSAMADYDITITKNSTETASPIPYLPANYKITAAIGTIGATPANMGWQITVHGADY